jgi:hypothetical protein
MIGDIESYCGDCGKGIGRYSHLACLMVGNIVIPLLNGTQHFRRLCSYWVVPSTGIPPVMDGGKPVVILISYCLILLRVEGELITLKIHLCREILKQLHNILILEM